MNEADDLVLATVAFWCLLVVAWIQVPKLWTHRTKVLDGRAPDWWLWGEAAFRGWVRAAVINVFTCTAVTLTVTLGFVLGIDLDDSGSVASAAAVVTMAISIGVTVLLFLTSLTVVFFNRPRIAVPPHLRAESGAIQVWFRAKRPRRRRKD